MERDRERRRIVADRVRVGVTAVRRAALALIALLAAGPALAENGPSIAFIAPLAPITDNSDRIASTQWVNNFFATGLPLASGKIFIGSAGGLAAQQTMSGDCTLSAAGVITCTQAAGNFTVIGNLSVGGTVIDASGELMTNIAAPATPAAGATRVYVDSTQKVLTFKNDAGTVGNAVVPSAAGSHQWASSISAAGIIGYTQPAFADLTGSATCAQEPARTGDVTAAAGSCANTAVKVNGVAYAASPSTDTVPVITAANTATYSALPNCTTGVLQYTTATHLFNCGAAGSGTVGTSGTPASPQIAQFTNATTIQGVTSVPVANGGTGDTGTAWSTFTPTVTCGSGSGTWSTSSSSFKSIGKTVFVSVNLALTTVGTCSGIPNFTLPVSTAASPATAAVRENNVGAAYFGWASTSSATMSFATSANGAPTFSSGQDFIASFVYQSN